MPDSFIQVPVRRGFKDIKNLYGFLGLYSAYICGGYVRYMASPDDNTALPSDIDIFCRDDSVFKDIYTEFDKVGLEESSNSLVAVTYKIPDDKNHLLYTPYPIQLVRSANDNGFITCGNIEEILTEFDLTIIRCGLKDEHTILADPTFIENEKDKELILRKVQFPPINMKRLFKYVSRGYNIPSSSEIEKVIEAHKDTSDYKITKKEVDNRSMWWGYLGGI